VTDPSSVADPGYLFTPLDPGWIFSVSRIRPFFDEIFLPHLQNPCYIIFFKQGYSWFLKLTRKTVSSKKKVPLCLFLLPPFCIGRRIRDQGWKNLGSESGKKHPGSATLDPSTLKWLTGRLSHILKYFRTSPIYHYYRIDTVLWRQKSAQGKRSDTKNTKCEAKYMQKYASQFPI
jgi:hypothetical protein